MSELLRELVEVLDLERVGDDVWRGASERDRHGRVYGGQAIAQALVAALRSTDGWPAHSLHAYFLRPGDPHEPIEYRVERVRDGRSFASRRIVALQRDLPILHMLASLQPPEPGPEHGLPMPDVPDPDTLPGPEELAREHLRHAPERMRGWVAMPRAIEVRYTAVPVSLGGHGEGRNAMWMRAPERVGDAPWLHQALLAYVSDLSFNDNAARPHVRPGELGLQMASVDHALWLHRPVRADDWLLFAQHSPHAAGARGFVRGEIFTRAGEHVASAAQECLLRPTG